MNNGSSSKAEKSGFPSAPNGIRLILPSTSSSSAPFTPIVGKEAPSIVPRAFIAFITEGETTRPGFITVLCVAGSQAGSARISFVR